MRERNIDLIDWDKVLTFIDSHLNRGIAVEELAGMVFLHPNYFISVFKRRFGCSPIQYITRKRLDVARALLAETELPVAEIAGCIGMQSPYLARLFKRHMGLTPLQYRYEMLGLRISACRLRSENV